MAGKELTLQSRRERREGATFFGLAVVLHDTVVLLDCECRMDVLFSSKTRLSVGSQHTLF